MNYYLNFSFIHLINPSILTLVSCLVLIYEFIDLLVPISIGMVYKNDDLYVKIKYRFHFLRKSI
jgi:hypothetical protein